MTEVKTRSIPQPKGTPARMGAIQWIEGSEVHANLDRGKKKKEKRSVFESSSVREARIGETYQKIPTGNMMEPMQAKGSRASEKVSKAVSGQSSASRVKAEKRDR